MTLGVLALFSLLLTLDDTALSVTLPSIGRNLGLGLSGLEWVVNSYTLALAALLLASHATDAAADRALQRVVSDCLGVSAAPAPCAA